MSIKATLSTQGWKDIERIIEEETSKMCDIRNIDHETNTNKIYGEKAFARAMAGVLIGTILNRIKKEADEEGVKKEAVKYI